MNEFEKNKETKRKSWNKKKAESNNKKKYTLFNSTLSVSKKENIKIYIDMIKEHAKTINQKIPIKLDGKRFIVHPNGRIYLDKDLTEY